MLRPIIRSIPNTLTLSRIGLAILFPFTSPQFWLLLIVLSLLTEFLDGFLARLLNAVTDFGRLSDPIADKVFIFSVVATLFLNDYVTLWELILISLRDLTVTAGAIYFWFTGLRGLVRAASPRISGKVTTAFQFFFLISLFTWPEASAPLFYITVGASFSSGIDYALNGFKQAQAARATHRQEAHA